MPPKCLWPIIRVISCTKSHSSKYTWIELLKEKNFHQKKFKSIVPSSFAPSLCLSQQVSIFKFYLTNLCSNLSLIPQGIFHRIKGTCWGRKGLFSLNSWKCKTFGVQHSLAAGHPLTSNFFFLSQAFYSLFSHGIKIIPLHCFSHVIF